MRLLCTAVAGVSVLTALPAVALEPTWLVVYGSDPLLNENGDGYWESATVRVYTDADAAHWTLTSPAGELVAEADLTDEQLASARSGWYGASLEVSSATAGVGLAAGTYAFTLTASSLGEEPSTRVTAIHVSTAPPQVPLTPSATVFYPRDTKAGLAHTVAFRHGLDATVREWSSARWEVVDSSSTRVAGPWYIEAADSLLRWDGTIQSAGGGTALAAAGTYRVRLVFSDGDQSSYGPLAQPFTLSWGYRVYAEQTTRWPANATRVATLTQRQARVRIVDGSLRYRAFNTDWRKAPLVRTAHRVRIPRGRIPGSWPVLVVRGPRQYDLDLDLEIVTPDGRVRNIDIYAGVDTRSMVLPLPRGWIRADGTVRFRLLWSSYGPTGAPHRVGRTDTVGVRIATYVWRGLE